MKKLLATIVVAALIGGAATLWFVFLGQHEQERDILAKLLKVEQELSETKSNLLGYTKFTDYVTESKKAIEGQVKFLAAKVDREYVHIEHIQKRTIGIKSEATIIVKYSVEYSFGFDLKPESFTVSSDKNGIVITLNKPDLVASPAVNILSHEIPSSGVLIDEKASVIFVHQQLFGIAKQRAKEVKNEEAVIALCEKKLTEFLVDFLQKQPNVSAVPIIKFSYK